MFNWIDWLLSGSYGRKRMRHEYKMEKEITKDLKEIERNNSPFNEYTLYKITKGRQDNWRVYFIKNHRGIVAYPNTNGKGVSFRYIWGGYTSARFYLYNSCDTSLTNGINIVELSCLNDITTEAINYVDNCTNFKTKKQDELIELKIWE